MKCCLHDSFPRYPRRCPVESRSSGFCDAILTPRPGGRQRSQVGPRSDATLLFRAVGHGNSLVNGLHYVPVTRWVGVRRMARGRGLTRLPSVTAEEHRAFPPNLVGPHAAVVRRVRVAMLAT